MPTPILDLHRARPPVLALMAERHGAGIAMNACTQASAVWQQLLPGGLLTAAECRELDGLARVRQLAPADVIFQRAQLATSLVALTEGEATLGSRRADGLLRTERRLAGPAWLDLSSAFIGVAHGVDAQATSAARVVDLPRSLLMDCLHRHPDLASRLIENLAREVHALAFNNHELMHKDAPARLAHWLRQRCLPMPGCAGQALVQLRERKRDVASQLAITPETLSRLLRSLAQQGLIRVAGYTVQVLDLPALEQLTRD